MQGSTTNHQAKAPHWAQTLLLVPSVLVLTLFLLRWLSPTGLPTWGRTLFLFSPVLVIYSIGILVVFIRRRVPVWVKSIQVGIILSALLPLLGIAWLVIRTACGVELLPVPSD